MINFKTYYDIICEGGNVFKANPTGRINLVNIEPTIQFLSNIVGFDLSMSMLGSTGKRESSGDLDLGIDDTKMSKQQLFDKLTAWCIDNKLEPKSYIAKSGISVHFRSPIIGKTNEYVQVDFMFVPDLEFASFAVSNNEKLPFKGVHWNIILSNLAKNVGYKWSGLNGIRTITKPEQVIENKDPEKVAKILLDDSSATKEDIFNITSILKFLFKKYNDIDKVKQLLDTSYNTILREYDLNIFDLIPTNNEQVVNENQTPGSRVGVQHLYTEYKPEQYSMSFNNFKTLIEILDEQGGVITPGNSSLSEKADGMSVKFGVTQDNEFFMQGSGGKSFSTTGDFEGAMESPNAQPAKKAFQSSFSKLKKLTYKILSKYKTQYNLDSISVRAEWLYSPLALHRDDKPGVVYFVATNYEKDKLGTWSTFPLISITDMKGNELPAEVVNSIASSLISLSNDDVKFISLNIEVFKPINLSSDIQKAKNNLVRLAKTVPNYEEVLYSASRKAPDRQAKKELQEQIRQLFLPIQKSMHTKILQEASRIGGKLGEFEGIVVKLKDKNNNPFLFKVISSQFHTQKGRE
jgi:hypothetical protein